MKGISGSGIVLTKQRRIAELSRQKLKGGLSSLNHYMDETWLLEAWNKTRKTGAAGIDGQTRTDFESELDKNLKELLEGLKSGNYKAPPVRRAYIPKADGSQRGLGVPTLGDKVAQTAIVMLLEPIFEQEFLPCSHGFRPRKGPRGACVGLYGFLNIKGGGYVVEADIKRFFDEINHDHLRAFLRERITDGVVLKLIDKWLKAGVTEKGMWSKTEKGSPQGGVISPMLANIYLHYVLDKWFMGELRGELKGEAELIRYADDFCICCRNSGDAEHVMKRLTERFAKYALSVHPEKSRIVPFKLPSRQARKADKRYTQTFDFLGFTYYWGMTRKGGWWVKLKTSKGKFTRGLESLSKWCKTNMHKPIREQLEGLVLKIRGHRNYFGVRNNSRAVDSFQYFALKIWRKWLSRRSNSGYVTLERMSRILQTHKYFRKTTPLQK